jgi:amino acid transporter
MLTILSYGILMVILIIAVICVMYGKTINETTRKWEINGLGIFGYVLAGIVIVIFISDGGYDLYNKIRLDRLAQLSKPIQSV